MWFLVIALVSFWSAGVAVSGELPQAEQELRGIEAYVREFRQKLGIEEQVAARVVESNTRLVSVYRSRKEAGRFIMEFDREFLSELTEEERRAAVAHEMGHVWIFTNHPFLQTEALANQKALQLVGRESLESIYEKVWAKEGQRGRIEELLGQADAAALRP